MRRLLVQSHRGGGALAPENSIESFMAAWEMGVVPEADLRTTSDGVIVAFHDESFERVVKDSSSDLQGKGIQDVTFEELSVLDVGSSKSDKFTGQRICSVTEIFTLMRGQSDRAVYLDIKDVQLPRLAELAREFGIEGQVILAAPDEMLLRDWRKLVPEGQTLLWMGILREGDERTLRHRLERLGDEGFAGITQMQIHVEAVREGGSLQFKPSLEFLQRAAAELKAGGILFQALPWECPDENVYHALLGAGVRSFASDYPEVALRVLSEWAESHPLLD